jgi:hypothetical protein
MAISKNIKVCSTIRNFLEQLIIFWSAPFYIANASGESSCPRFRAAEFF